LPFPNDSEPNRISRSNVGDWLRAIGLLKVADPVLRRQIGEAMGVGYSVEPVPPVPKGPWKIEDRVDDEPEKKDVQRPPVLNEIPLTLRYLDDGLPQTPPQWVQAAVPLPRTTSPFHRLPAKPSLLNPTWTRALLVAALSSWDESNDVDIPTLIARLTTGQPLDQLPLLRVLTMSRGVHCWMDDGLAMQPFLQDQRHLLTALRRVAGAFRVSVARFRIIPDLASFFAPGQPHLILSDLGRTPLPEDTLGPPANLDDWQSFAHKVRNDLGGRLVALTPWPVTDYPAKIRRSMTLLSWDRTTSVQDARRMRAEAS
jgi:hypothetical protein